MNKTGGVCGRAPRSCSASRPLQHIFATYKTDCLLHFKYIKHVSYRLSINAN